jgi:hypothetical protein
VIPPMAAFPAVQKNAQSKSKKLTGMPVSFE